MKTIRTNQEWQRPLAFLAEAPLGWLVAHGQIRQFAAGSPVLKGDQSGEWAFLVLGGSCQWQRALPAEAGPEILHTYQQGETFGGFLRPDTTIIAAEDSSVFCIRLRDLVDIAPKINGHGRSGAAESSDTARFTFTFNAPKGKLATLAFFSTALPETSLAESIARRLQAETDTSVMLVQLVTSVHEEADCVLDDKFVLPSELREIGAGLRLLRIRIPGEPPAPEVLGEQFRRLRFRFDHVLLAVPADRVPPEWLLECLRQSRTGYLFLRRNAEDLYHLDLLFHELQPALKSLPAVEFKAVLCLDENETVAGFDAQIEKIGISPQFFIRHCPMSAGASVPSGPAHADIRRIARSIGNCLVGLALSSGAAKGFSHVGVLQVFEENGIEPDVIAGSSMGAYVGALWAYGCNGAQLEKLSRDMEGKWSLWNLIDPAFPPRQGFLHGCAIKRRLQQTIGDVQFSDLVRPLRVLATNLATLGRVVFSRGDVATAVHTSVAVPGIFVPVRLGEESFVDGGIVEILMNSIHGAQIRMADASCQRASVVLRPDVGDDRWLDFRHPLQYIQAGREVALRQLDEIKTLVQEKGTTYEFKPAPESLVAVA